MAAATAAAMKLRLHFVVDPVGWLCVSLVLAVWVYNTVVVPQLVLLPHYHQGHLSWTVVVCECCRQRREGAGRSPADANASVSVQAITWRRRSASPPCSEPPPPTRDASPQTPTYLSQVSVVTSAEAPPRPAPPSLLSP